MAKLYKLTDGDKALIQKAQDENNPNWFTSWFLKSDSSGYYIKPDVLYKPYNGRFPEKYQEFIDRYHRMYSVWESLGKPDTFRHEDKTVKVRKSRDYKEPIFHMHFGAVMQQWQIEAYRASQRIKIILGGYGTADIDTRIYEADMRQYVSLRWCIQNNHAPTVLSKTRDGWSKVKASLPYWEGMDEMYRLVTNSGKVMYLGAGHRIMTARGYVHVRDLVPQDKLVAPNRLPSTVHDESACVQPDSGISADSQSDYQSHPRLYDEPLLQDQDNGLNAVPSQVGVQESIRYSLSGLHIQMGEEQVCTVPEYLRRGISDLDHTHYSTHLLVLQAGSTLQYREREASDVLVRPLQADRALQQSGDTSSLQYWQDILSAQPIDLAPSPASSNSDGQIVWSYDESKCNSPEPSDPILWLGQPYSKNHTSLLAPEFAPDSIDKLPDASQTTLAFGDSSSLDDDWQSHYTTYDELKEVEYIGLRDIYDLHVPIYNNYLAEGLIHHNSGKTFGAVLPMLYYAATIPGFRGLFLAPNSNQAKESWRIALQIMYGTPYMEKFLVGKNAKDPPSLTIGNDMVGENLIQTFPIDDPAGVEKFETLTLDYVVIDQAEKMPNIQEIRRVIGSRFRGQIMGRDIVGQMMFLANAKDNPELWDLFDEAEDDPDNIYAVQPATFDNIYITPEQLMNMEGYVGGTDEDVRVHIEGGRPLLTGEQFPATLQANIKSDILDEKMRQGLENHLPGFVHIKAPKKVGTVRWEMPPEQDRLYCVIADPGSDNPPKRNSAVIMVWDYTDFPGQPATLQAFNWVYGNHRPEPWITQYLEYVERYRAKTTNAFDSTAWQSGWQESLWAINRTIAGGMPLHLNHKSKYLIFTKRLCELGLLKVPSIQGLFTQLGRYVVPDNDKKLVQDIVMAFILSGGWLEHLMYGEPDQQEETEQHVREFLEGRYASEVGDRYNREQTNRYA